MDEGPLLDLIARLRIAATDPGLGSTLKTRAAILLPKLEELLAAVRAGNELLVDEIVRGTFTEDGRRRSDGLAQVVPLWARDPATLAALAGIVVVDESVHPVTVTVHWERVPANLRREAVSLASELVDAHRDRPKGGRPPGSRKQSRRKPGHPDTWRAPA